MMKLLPIHFPAGRKRFTQTLLFPPGSARTGGSLDGAGGERPCGRGAR